MNEPGPFLVKSRAPKQVNSGAGRCAHTIYQGDLEEIFAWRRRVRDASCFHDASSAQECLRTKELYIEAALRAGAAVEPGVHTAQLVPARRAHRFRLEIQ